MSSSVARKHTIEALDVLVQIMLNEKAPPNAREMFHGRRKSLSAGATALFLVDLVSLAPAAAFRLGLAFLHRPPDKVHSRPESTQMLMTGEFRATENGTPPGATPRSAVPILRSSSVPST